MKRLALFSGEGWTVFGSYRAMRGVCFCLAVVLGGVVGTGNLRAEETHRLKVVATFVPMYCLAANVAGNLADVENLVPASSDPHEVQFSARDMRKLESADLLVENGLGIESWLDRILRPGAGPKAVVVASAGLDKDLITEEPYLDLGGGIEANERHAPNPHVWLDPTLAAREVTNILAAFEKADPANATGYERNAKAYLAKLDVLDKEISHGLASKNGDALVCYHDAFAYFARHYDLRIVAVVEIMPDVEPSPRHLARVGEVIKREHVKAVFGEQQSPTALVEQIGQDYGVKVGVLNTLETGALTPEVYQIVMKENLKVLQEDLP